MKKLITLVLAITASVAISQTNLSPQMINTAGGSGLVAGTYYDYTVGEPITLFGGIPTGCDSIFSGFQHCAIDTLRINKATITVGGALTFCLTQSVTLTAPTSAGGSYLWSNGATTQSITASPTVTTTYHVRTTNTCGDTIGSNNVIVTIINSQTPSICMVTSDSMIVADSTKNNIIYWNKTGLTHVDSFIVYREVSTGIYKRIGAVSKDSLSMFIDTDRNIGPANGNPMTGSYRYKLQIRDTCGNYGTKSPYHNTVNFIDNHTGTFLWNTYDVESQVTPVANFFLMRDDNNTGAWHQIGAAVSGTQTSLTDPNYSTYQAQANWRVDATGFNCTPTMRLGNNSTQSTVVKSRSNVRNNRTTGSSQLAVGSRQVLVYPNPANNELTVLLNNNCNNCQIEIINVLGETVKNISVTNTENKINISEIENGVYFVKVISNGNSSLQKLIVQH